MWDFCGGIGFFVGPSHEHSQCYKVIKNSTQYVVVNDTVVFQHPTMACPILTPKDRIIHCFLALTKAIQADITPDSTHAQLLVIESLRAIFTPNKMTPTAILANNGVLPPELPVPPPRVAAPLPTVEAASPRVPAPIPRVEAASPLVSAPPTRAATSAPQFGATTTDQPINRHTHRGIANANLLSVSFSLPAKHFDK